MVDEAHAEVTKLLEDHRAQLDSLSHALLKPRRSTPPTRTPPRACRCGRRSWRRRAAERRRERVARPATAR